jgi:membrane protease YdiL (CAAX protease family)
MGRQDPLAPSEVEGREPTPAGPRLRSGPTEVRECLSLWLLAIGGVALAKWVLDPLLGAPLAGVPLIDGLFHPKTIAAVLFLYLPVWAMKRRDEYPEDYGLRFSKLGPPLRLFGWMALATLPLYIAGYVAFVRLLPQLPSPLAHVLVPYGAPKAFALRLPDRFALKVLDQLLVVALPEELFYRGYLQQRLKLQLGEGPLLFGVHIGRAFWLTQALFALGHLVEPYPWRLAVFFPALLFGWLREKSGSLPAGILYHASCNLLVLVLEASFF